MNIHRTRPPFTADEPTQLVSWLDMQRAVVLWKCEGLSETDAHRAVLPASPRMTMAGLLAHLRWTESTWFEVMFLGRPDDNPQFSEDEEDADMLADGLTLPQLIDNYKDQCDISNRIIAEHDLDQTGNSNSKYRVSEASLRWMVLHMIEETARHAGHADAIRELLDGQTGYY
ncbi:DinB family protein [Haloglycomyces albus]|uniref:DinB family protein n=1 Tax=Haloglycomyces albus TaxID=526067 RepID=UPI00046CAE80|nr:DinB family protein [Haloglycomyces albus]